MLYADEHKIVVSLDEIPDSLETWDSATISLLDISSMATLHLVTSKFKEFPQDSAALDSLRDTLDAMDLGPLLGLFLQSFIVQVCSTILSVAIFVIVYGRMV